MAWAKCVDCGQAVAWKAGKGCKLSLLKCPKCGGKLKGCSMEKALEGLTWKEALRQGKIASLHPLWDTLQRWQRDGRI